MAELPREVLELAADQLDAEATACIARGAVAEAHPRQAAADLLREHLRADAERAPASEEGELVATYVFDFGTGEMTITPVDERAPAAGAQEPPLFPTSRLETALLELEAAARLDARQGGALALVKNARRKVLQIAEDTAPAPQVAEPSGVEREALEALSEARGALLEMGSVSVPVCRWCEKGSCNCPEHYLARLVRVHGGVIASALRAALAASPAQPTGEEDADDEAWLEERLKVAAQDVARDTSHLARARSNRMRATALRSLEYATSARNRWCRILARLRAGRDATPASDTP